MMVFCLRIWADGRLPRADGDLSADDLVREYHQFERSVLWRRRREITGALGGLVVAAGYILRKTDLAPRIGWALSTLLALAILFYLARKTSVARYRSRRALRPRSPSIAASSSAKQRCSEASRGCGA